MSPSRIPFAAAVGLLLLTACAGRDFAPADLEPDAGVGAWTTFEFGRFPAGFEDEVEVEIGRAGAWEAEFQRLVDREWPLPATVTHLPTRSREEIPASREHVFFSTDVFAELDAFLVFTLDYHLEGTADGLVPVLAVSARVAPLAGNLRPWTGAVAERGAPVDALAVSYGALGDQFPVLAERCVVRLMELVGR